MANEVGSRPGVPPLEVFKALGDNTRYAIYRQLLESPRPLATAELAERLGLHPNTVRPHLERLRDAGLVEVGIDARGEIGRPQHRYFPAPDAPSLGMEPAALPLYGELMTEIARLAGAGGTEAYEIGRRRGLGVARRYQSAPSCLEALVSELDRMGFDPDVSEGGDEDTAIVGFAHCPYRAMAESAPELVCSLHRGVVDGFVDAMGDAEVTEFCTLADRTPCQVAITSR